MAVNFDVSGSGKYTGPNPDAVAARAKEIYALGGSSKQSALAVAVYEANAASGNTQANQDNLKQSQKILKSQADARSAAGIRNVGLITAAGFALPLGAAALGGGIAGGLGTAGETGLSAGNAAGLGTFAGHAALTGALTGAGGGLVGGGGIKGALEGAALGGLTGGFGGGAASSLGLSGAGAGAFTGGLNGLAGGVASGKGLKGALIGTGLGAAGGYLSAGGLGTAAGSPVSGTISGPTQGTGVLGSVTRTIPGLSSIVGGASKAGGSLSSYAPLLNAGASLYSGVQSTDAAEQARKQLLAAQGKAASLLNPYISTGKQANSALSTNLANGFDASSLPNDAGYQFQLGQGQQALDRTQASRGGFYSGGALKAAADYSKGLTDTTLQDAFNRYQAQNSALQTASNSGQTAANSLGDIYTGIGNTNATADVTKSNILNSTLSNVLSGQGGVYNTGSGGLNIQQLLALLGKNGTTGATA